MRLPGQPAGDRSSCSGGFNCAEVRLIIEDEFNVFKNANAARLERRRHSIIIVALTGCGVSLCAVFPPERCLKTRH